MFAPRWTLMQQRRRAVRHRRVAWSLPRSAALREFHLAQAEFIEALIQRYRDRRGVPNLVVLDFFRPDP
jgi:hypothetical protein